MMEGGWWYSGYDSACLNGMYDIFEETGFYWNSDDSQLLPPETSSLVGVTPGRLRMSRIMIARP